MTPGRWIIVVLVILTILVWALAAYQLGLGQRPHHAPPPAPRQHQPSVPWQSV